MMLICHNNSLTTRRIDMLRCQELDISLVDQDQRCYQISASAVALQELMAGKTTATELFVLYIRDSE